MRQDVDGCAIPGHEFAIQPDLAGGGRFGSFLGDTAGHAREGITGSALAVWELGPICLGSSADFGLDSGPPLHPERALPT
jgi:hypothetical protein